MRLCSETITVFNAKLDTALDRDVYTGTVIRGVSWFCEVATSVDSGLKAANKITIRVPDDANFSGKRYVTPKEYATSDAADTFTIQAGDIIVRGEVAEENPKPSELKKSYTDFTTVLGVTDNRRVARARHWKVVGA